MNTPIRPVPPPVEPSVIAASANERLSIQRYITGAARITNESGDVIIRAAAIAPLRHGLRELDAIPRLHAAEFTEVPVTHDVVLVVCSDGTVIIVVGTGYPYATVQLEISDVGIVARSLGQ